MGLEMDYFIEPKDDILCVDVKSFYASVECVERGLNPLKAMLVVMSNAENAGGLVLAASPASKKRLGISNVMRKYDLPEHKDLIIVPPRMSLYIEKNKEILNIFRKYAIEDDILVYSIDEAFIRVSPVKKLFHSSAYEIARKIQKDIYHSLGLYVTVGIGDNLLLAKLALDNEAKNAKDFKAEWRYEDVQEKVWSIDPLTNFWGIGSKTANKLKLMGIRSIRDLANADVTRLKNKFGVLGEQLYAHSWGLDRSDITKKHMTLEKSYGNSQVLTKDYYIKEEIEVVIKEIAEQVASRLRKHDCQSGCVSLMVGYSMNQTEKGFNRQMKIPFTNNTKEIAKHCLFIFNKYYTGSPVRHLGVSCSKLKVDLAVQLDLFKEPESQLNEFIIDDIVDRVRGKYGFSSIVHASSLIEGATAIKRSSLVGGHASGRIKAIAGIDKNE